MKLFSWIVVVCSAGFILVLASLGLVVSYRAEAQASEVLFGIGRLLFRYAGADHQDHPRALFFNGKRLWLSVGMTNDSIEQVLNAYERNCSSYNVFGANLSTSFRERYERMGVLTCFDPPGTHSTLRQTIDRFMNTKDFSAFGNIRYVYAQPRGSKTEFATLWTEGPIRVEDLFPKNLDAPGKDPDDVPRPPRSKRVMSFWEGNHRESFSIYENISMPLEDIESFYEKALPATGWMSHKVVDEPAKSLFILERPKRLIALMLQKNAAQSGTMTTILDMR